MGEEIVLNPDLLADFALVVDIPVAWGEMDALGHVNNAVYFKYFETARMAYFAELELLAHMETTGVGPILASTHCKFKRPVKYPDTLSIGVRAADLQEDRFVSHYRIVSKAQKAVVADGEGLIVTYDYSRNLKAPIPDVIRDRIIKLEKLD